MKSTVKLGVGFAAAGVATIAIPSADAKATVAVATDIVSVSPVSAAPAQAHLRISGDSTAAMSMRLPSDPDRWSNTLERKFDALAMKQALGESTREEDAELAKLERLRMQLQSPLSGDEAMKLWLHAKKLEKLRDALKEYVEFTRSPAYAKA